jgi:hypothetical protein
MVNCRHPCHCRHLGRGKFSTRVERIELAVSAKASVTARQTLLKTHPMYTAMLTTKAMSVVQSHPLFS